MESTAIRAIRLHTGTTSARWCRRALPVRGSPPTPPRCQSSGRRRTARHLVHGFGWWDGIFRVSMSALAVRRAGWVRRAFALRPYRKHLSVGRRHPSRGDPPPRNPNHRFPWGSRASLALLPHSGLCFPMAGLHCFALVRPSPQAPRPCSASPWQACTASPWGARRGWSPRRDVVRRAMNAGRNTCVRCGTDSRGSAVSGL